MENLMENNRAHLVGRVVSGPVFSHKTYGEAFYNIILGIVRRSGYEDKIRVIVSDYLMGGRAPREEEILEIHGQVRTYNRQTEKGTRLEITVFARSLEYLKAAEPEDINEIFLEGFLCKTPVRRISPMGRDICDLMIAVNRLYNKSDYIPAIAWGRNAAYGEQLNTGDKIQVEGRLQSREYRKRREDGTVVTKTAYEVSVASLMNICDI